MNTLVRFLRDERGTETVEWAIVIGIIAVGALVAITSIAGKVQDQFIDLDAGIPPVD